MFKIGLSLTDNPIFFLYFFKFFSLFICFFQINAIFIYIKLYKYEYIRFDIYYFNSCSLPSNKKISGTTYN